MATKRESFFCRESEVRHSGSLIKFVDEIRDEIISVVEEDGKIRCFSSVCPHLAGEIHCEAGSFQCRWHGLKFDGEGRCENSNRKLRLREYETVVRDAS